MTRDLYDVGAFLDERLAAMEERAGLERVGALGAAIEYELIEGGPLKLYLEARRQEAGAALIALAEADPRDAVSIAEAQATVREYVKAARWIAARVEDADHAQEQIEREYGRHDAIHQHDD